MKKQLYRAAAATVLGLSLTTGIVAADSINTTGPDSTNRVHSSVSNKVRVDNDNDLAVVNGNLQWAGSGNASAHHNTTAGDATSGNASNGNNTGTSVSVDNTGAVSAAAGMGGGSNAAANISNTGPDSTNKITESTKNSVHVDNDNDVQVWNINLQGAESGNAKVSDNTTGGDATSGNASNTNTTSTTVTVKN